MDDGTDDWYAPPDEGFIGLVGPIYQKPLSGGVGHFRFIPEDRHRNRSGFVQGGMIMTFFDRSMGTTARQADPGRRQATVQLDVHFIRAVRIGETVDLECRITKETRTLVFIDGNMTVGDELVATARGVWKIIEGRASPDDAGR